MWKWWLILTPGSHFLLVADFIAFFQNPFKKKKKTFQVSNSK